MAQNFLELSQTQIEKLLLRGMCQPEGGESAWTVAADALRTYRWREPVHKALFAALGDLLARKPALMRELLPAALTRRGFPDVPWEDFFKPLNLSEEDARSLLQRLLRPDGM
jgi:hypothetical protein